MTDRMSHTLVSGRSAGSASVARRADYRSAIDKAVSVLDAFEGCDGTAVGVSELSRRTGLAKSTVYRIVGSLVRNGIVEPVGSRYRIGLRLERIARPEQPQDDLLREVLTPFLVELHQATGLTVHLGVLRGGDVVYLNKLHGRHRHRCPTRIGGRAPSYCTAIGKALLTGSPSTVDAVVARGLRGWTPSTARDAEGLRYMLDRTREEGVAVDEEECRPALGCMAVLVTGPAGVPNAALSIAGAAGEVTMGAHGADLRRIGYAARLSLREELAVRFEGSHLSGRHGDCSGGTDRPVPDGLRRTVVR
ncbi:MULTISPECIES: IclR family transcriptional regulator [unclassified Pseudonocardia]|uniref:IclR family transcriptional regulator n=1 Tax=unclassified Pseudonocardia TaxID=2619320 RepID=UPI000760D186|nr:MULTISPECIES: IclR family transcriptional regulator [unclassified Pseudonocardia]